MADTLVVYFSRSGSTEAMARSLAARLGADLDAIEAARPYAGVFGFIRGVWESLRSASPGITHAKDPATYALVVIGSPVWAGRLAGPVRSYLRDQGGRIQSVAAFCVSGSGRMYESCFKEIEALTGKPPKPILALSQRAVVKGLCEGEIDAFAKGLQTPPVRPPRKPQASRKAPPRQAGGRAKAKPNRAPGAGSQG